MSWYRNYTSLLEHRHLQTAIESLPPLCYDSVAAYQFHSGRMQRLPKLSAAAARHVNRKADQ